MADLENVSPVKLSLSDGLRFRRKRPMTRRERNAAAGNPVKLGKKKKKKPAAFTLGSPTPQENSVKLGRGHWFLKPARRLRIGSFVFIFIFLVHSTARLHNFWRTEWPACQANGKAHNRPTVGPQPRLNFHASLRRSRPAIYGRFAPPTLTYLDVVPSNRFCRRFRSTCIEFPSNFTEFRRGSSRSASSESFNLSDGLLSCPSFFFRALLLFEFLPPFSMNCVQRRQLVCRLTEVGRMTTQLGFVFFAFLEFFFAAESTTASCR